MNTFIRQLRHLISLLGYKQTIIFIMNKIIRTKVVKLNLPTITTHIYCRPNTSDIFTLWQVFGKEDCYIKLPRNPRLIVDCGAYAGYTSVYFANKYPMAKIIAVEPDQSNCEMFEMNCSYYPHIKLIKGGVWNKRTNLRIINPDADKWSFKLSEDPLKSGNSLPGITINDILSIATSSSSETNANIIDILKIDIEGAEEIIFSDKSLNWINNVYSMIIEFHSKKSKELIIDVMSKFNYNIYQQREKYIFIKKDR